MRIGGLIAGRRRYEVSMGRLDALVAPQRLGKPDVLTGHIDMPVLGGPAVPALRLADRQPLARLEVRGLAIDNRGLSDVSFALERGTLTVVSGPVGSGKTSLLRGILGLLDLDAGEVLWNGEVVGDRAAFFVPPQSAYVAQVPRLFAESLADNLRLGHIVSPDQMDEAIRLAAFEEDVADLPEGLATMVGARGVRLSGGQAQRAAGARALAHRPELLVLDDLTSALDVETERILWERLAEAGYTVIAASNRPVALARADQVIALG
jgi:ATP-binding cassette, subfamily B, bacterial